MRILQLLLLSLVLTGCQSGPAARSPQHDGQLAATQEESNRDSQIKIGEGFKIKNIPGIVVTASVVEKDGKHYIRSRYHHGWKSELRDYAITNAVRFATTSGCAINIWFPHAADAKLAGAVYVINNHGEAVKADDITMIDLTW